MKNTNARKRNSSGFTLIEVLMGILIFAVGMMALAKLQGNLQRPKLVETTCAFRVAFSDFDILTF